LTEAGDLSDITCPRLAAAGADLNRVSTPESPQPAESDNSDVNDENNDKPAPPFNLTNLEQEIQSMPNCRLVIIDPLTEFLPPTKSRSKRPDWPSIFKTLAGIAARTGVAIVALMSFIPSTSAAANHRAVATLAAHPGPACVWRVTTDPPQENLRHLTPIKNNLAPRNAPLSFELESTPDQPTAKVVWKEDSSEAIPPIRVPLAPPVPNTESKSAPQQPPAKQTPVPPRRELTAYELAEQRAEEKAIANAAAWLTRQLKSRGGQQLASQVRHAARFEQIPTQILNLAKEQANIHSAPSHFADDELWKLP
jgi:hypothetical protein